MSFIKRARAPKGLRVFQYLWGGSLSKQSISRLLRRRGPEGDLGLFREEPRRAPPQGLLSSQMRHQRKHASLRCTVNRSKEKRMMMGVVEVMVVVVVVVV